MNIRSVINAIEDFAPRALQESYDNAGLQAGDATNICTGVLLTLDVNENTVTEAKEYGLNCIISHHPLLFKGIKSISPDTPTGRILIDAISNGITIYSAHTNLDNARFGVSNRMAQMLGLSGIRTLQPQSATLVKLAVFVPEAHADKVRDAMADAGAGAIGDYDRCSYSLEGTGRFRAATGANPFVGEIGEIHQEAETKIEVIAPRRLSGRIIRAMLDAHPYEEPAYDIIPLDNAERVYRPAESNVQLQGNTLLRRRAEDNNQSGTMRRQRGFSDIRRHRFRSRHLCHRRCEIPRFHFVCRQNRDCRHRALRK